MIIKFNFKNFNTLRNRSNSPATISSLKRNECYRILGNYNGYYYNARCISSSPLNSLPINEYCKRTRSIKKCTIFKNIIRQCDSTHINPKYD